MASSADEALHILNQSYKDILIQAGKHFRVIAKDGPGALVGTHGGIQAKTSDSLSQYHLALNDIESEIIQARSVLLRDLENLRAARVPAPAPAPTPIPAPRFTAPPAPMMELPSSAAHSRNLNPSVTAAHSAVKVTKTVAPFPDMGMGMSADVVDLTSGEKKPSPRVQSGSIKSMARPAPSSNVPNVKPSPKLMHKSTLPAKVTPVPPPQIPRPQAFQSPNTLVQPKPQPAPPGPKPIQPPQPVHQAPGAKMVQGTATGGMPVPPPPGVNDGSTSGAGNSELNFTDMEFSLAPPLGESKGAPPAPMPQFDLATFAPQNGKPNATTSNAGGNAGGNVAGNNSTQPPNPGSNMDDLFNLGDNGGNDNMFDLGGAEANDSTFDDMMFFGNNDNNDTDMDQFDDAYFGL